MSVNGWAAFVGLVATIPTHAAALRNEKRAMKRRRKEPGLCFTTEEKGYSLLGCYGRPRSGGEVFGDEFITLIPVSGDQSTASTCLEGCAEAVPRGKTGGMYSHVAISEGRYAAFAAAKYGWGRPLTSLRQEVSMRHRVLRCGEKSRPELMRRPMLWGRGYILRWRRRLCTCVRLRRRSRGRTTQTG